MSGLRGVKPFRIRIWFPSSALYSDGSPGQEIYQALKYAKGVIWNNLSIVGLEW